MGQPHYPLDHRGGWPNGFSRNALRGPSLPVPILKWLFSLSEKSSRKKKKNFRRRHHKRVIIKIVSTTGSTPYTTPKFTFQMNFGIKVTKLSLSTQAPSVSWSAETNQEDKIMIKSYYAGGSVPRLKNFNLFNYHNPPRWLCPLVPHYRQQTQGLRR